MPRVTTVTLVLSEAMADALRKSTPLCEATSGWLAPPVGTWVGLAGCEVRISGNEAAKVREIAERYRRVDEFVRAHGVNALDPDRAHELAREIQEERELRLRYLGLEKTPSGRWGLRVAASRQTMELLSTRLRWFVSLVQAVRARLECAKGEIWVSGRWHEDAQLIARELHRVEALRYAEARRDAYGLGAVEAVLPPSSEEGLCFRDLYVAHLHRAAATGDWREANKAYAMAGIRTRIRVDPVTGRAQIAIYWLEDDHDA